MIRFLYCCTALMFMYLYVRTKLCLSKEFSVIAKCYHFVCSFIHLAIRSNATGENVCSISEYSEIDPVLDSWNRWFRFSNSTISMFLLPFFSREVFIAARFSFAGT